MRFKVVLTTVADLTVEVEADSEDAALDAAYEMGREFAERAHGDGRYTVAVNEAWDLREPEVKEL